MNTLIMYSSSCCTKPLRLSYFSRRQMEMFGRMFILPFPLKVMVAASLNINLVPDVSPKPLKDMLIY